MNYGIEGHRYVRQYRLKDGTSRWSLWEFQGNGEKGGVATEGRRKRVGTAHTEAEVAQFLGTIDLDIRIVRSELQRLEREWFDKMAQLADLETLATL